MATRESSWGTSPGLEVDAKQLARLSPYRPLAETVLTWAVIAAIVIVYRHYPTAWTFAAAFILIASRQYALLILLHDAFHSLLHPNRRVNDFVGSMLVGAPCGSAYWAARAAHLEHHRKLGEHDDPEFFLHCVGPPSEKRNVAGFIRHFVALILGRQILYTHLGAAGVHDVAGRQWVQLALRLGRVAIVQLVLLGIFVLADSWTTYFTLWALPLLTLTVLFNGVRAFCDHANLSDSPGDKAHRLVSYVSSSVERFFLAPFHMNYHAEHHLFPYVPHYRLPELRNKIMVLPEHRSIMTLRSGYLAFMRQFLRAQRVAASSVLNGP